MALSLLAPGTHPAAADAKTQAPAWLSQAASLRAPIYDPKVPAVVLHEEETLDLEEDGRVKGTARYAVRILRYEGRGFARAARSYRTDGGSIRELKAWLIHPHGDVVDYGKRETLDLAAALNDVYDEARVRVIDASADADVGSVFGFEVSFVDRTFSGQFLWSFQSELPSLVSRFTLNLPPGWSARAMTFNHEPVASSVNGSAHTWELSNMPWIEDEPARPPVTALAPRLAIDAVSPDPAARARPASFGSWAGVAAWLDGLSAASAAPDAAITSKARLLASGAPTTFGGIRAIGRYVQSLAYIAIQLDVSRGGGYRPHPAAEVFAKSYGDCKDKANLMKAMLACVGVESYLAVIRGGDPAFVREEWPSPHQFDHCIIAVRADAESAAAALSHPSLGPLIFFDPTDPNTPFGDLPAKEQGGFALLVMKEGGDLVRAPVIPAEMNRLERHIDAKLDASGAVHGSIRERSRGREATAERRFFHNASQAEYRGAIEAWVTQGAPGATVSEIRPRDREQEGGFELELRFSAPGYAQLTGPRIMVFRPAIVSRRDRLSLTTPARKYPVMLDGWTYGETAGTELPSGYDVEELPAPISLTSSFGSYSATTQARDGKVLFTRSMKLNSMAVPVDQYDSLRTFFERIRSAELTPVVLSRR